MEQGRNDIGVVGLAVMGRNLALNLLDKGFRVSGWNLEPELTDQAAQESNGRLAGCASLGDLVESLEPPRRILVMVKAGPPVDAVLEGLAPLLQGGDVVIDGGNSHYRDTRRREASYRERGLSFVGMGVSGGEEGARNGPSLMPGGDERAYERLRPLLEAIAARSDSGPCVTHVGPDGAGHFVKMVHNGIEYADMQLIAEAYDLLRRALGMGDEALRATFDGWRRGPLASYLMDITTTIFGVIDPQGDGLLVEKVLDRAGQKGTGRWAGQEALELGVPIPAIMAATEARELSADRAARLALEEKLGDLVDGDHCHASLTTTELHDALLTAKILAYAQGMELIRVASAHYGWQVDLAEVARIWKAGCIIRARLLDEVREAFGAAHPLDTLLAAPRFQGLIRSHHNGLRAAVGTGVTTGIPTPAMAASLSYLDGYRTGRLPQNLVQAQRDAFGAHTYRRLDDPSGTSHHTSWLETT